MCLLSGISNSLLVFLPFGKAEKKNHIYVDLCVQVDIFVVFFFKIVNKFVEVVNKNYLSIFCGL